MPPATTGPGRNVPQNLDNNLSHREYFVEALAQGRSMQFLLGRATRQPGLYFANRIATATRSAWPSSSRMPRR